MSLSGYIDDVIETLEEELNAPADDWSVGLLKGERAQARHAAPPRIIFIPNGGGPDTFSGARQHASMRTNGRSILTRRANLQVRIWAAAHTSPGPLVFDDYGAAEYLAERTIVAMRTAAWGSIQWGEGRFLPESPNNLGRLYAFDAVVELPVLESYSTSVLPETADLSAGLVNPYDDSETSVPLGTVTLP